jgi:hypothetical protein
VVQVVNVSCHIFRLREKLRCLALASYCIHAAYSNADATECYRIVLSVSKFSREICGWNIGREIGYIREEFCFIFSVLSDKVGW